MDISLILVVLVLSAVLNYSIQKIFNYYKKFDDFNHRSSHNTLATRTGGIGIFTTLLLVSLFFYFQGIEIFDYSLFIPLGIMFVVGVYDDFYNADFKLKFFLQIIVAKILIDQGYVISNYNGLFGLYEVPWLLAQFSTVFLFLVVVNSINFIDGIDGLAISVVIKSILFIEFISSEPTVLFPLGYILIFCIIPLYYFNFKKSKKVFLGDSGSLILGSIVCIYLLNILGSEYKMINEIEINKSIFSIVVLFYPLFDLIRVFSIRLFNKKSPFEADQKHIHHLLLFKFKKHYQVTIAIILLDSIISLLMLSAFNFF